MSWQAYIDDINENFKDEGQLEQEAFENWKRDYLSTFSGKDRENEEKELDNKGVSDLSDAWDYYESSGGGFRDYDDFKEAYMPVTHSYGEIDFSALDDRDNAIDQAKDDWLDEMQTFHPDNFRRAQWNKNKNSIYWYDKDGNKHRASTHLANTANGENVYDWIVKSGNDEDIPYKVEDVVNGKAKLEDGERGDMMSRAHSALKTGGSNQNETPAHIIPYSEVGNYEDSFDGDEEREEDKRNSDELTKREIKTFK